MSDIMESERESSPPSRHSSPLHQSPGGQETISSGNGELVRSRPVSDTMERKLHMSCGLCNHFHDGSTIRIPVDAQRYQLFKCERCFGPLFGLGGDSTHISLVSEETIITIDSNIGSDSGRRTSILRNLQNVTRSSGNGGEITNTPNVDDRAEEAHHYERRLSGTNGGQGRLSEERQDGLPEPLPAGGSSSTGEASASRQRQNQSSQPEKEPGRWRSQVYKPLKGIRKLYRKVKTHLKKRLRAPPTETSPTQSKQTSVASVETPSEQPNREPSDRVAANDGSATRPRSDLENFRPPMRDATVPETTSERIRRIRHQKTLMARARRCCCRESCRCRRRSRLTVSRSESRSSMPRSAVPGVVMDRTENPAAVVAHLESIFPWMDRFGGTFPERINWSRVLIPNNNDADRSQVRNTEISFESQASTAYSPERHSTTSEAESDMFSEPRPPPLSIDTQVSTDYPATIDEDIEDNQTPTQTTTTEQERTPTASGDAADRHEVMNDGPVDPDRTLR